MIEHYGKVTMRQMTTHNGAVVSEGAVLYGLERTEFGHGSFRVITGQAFRGHFVRPGIWASEGPVCWAYSHIEGAEDAAEKANEQLGI